MLLLRVVLVIVLLVVVVVVVVVVLVVLVVVVVLLLSLSLSFLLLLLLLLRDRWEGEPFSSIFFPYALPLASAGVGGFKLWFSPTFRNSDPSKFVAPVSHNLF